MAGKTETQTGAKNAGGKKPALKIHATQDSRWRAGINFGREPQTILVSRLSKKKIELLKADPMLVVEEVGT